MSDCIFCKIVSGDAPSYKVYEDEMFYVLLDIFPRTRGHALVIPKKHHRWTYDVPEYKDYWAVVLKITKAMQKAFSPEFISHVTHGLEVPHAHIHVLPRYKDDLSFVPSTKTFTKEEMNEILDQIRKAL